MGAAVYAVFEKPINEASEVEGKMLSKKLGVLDAYAAEQGIEPLSAFISLSPEMREFAIDEGVDPEAMPAEAWFEPELGLTTVRALRLSELGRTCGVDSDLDALERALASAKARGVRFHIVVDG